MVERKDPKRITYHVVPGAGGGWAVKGEGSMRASAIAERKQDAIRAAKALAKGRPLGQVVIHRKDGVIQTEWTYGKDPRKYPG